jgi:hypothetical protein
MTEAFGLFYADFLLNVRLQKFRHDIKLLFLPIIVSNKRELHPNINHSHSGREGLLIVSTMLSMIKYHTLDRVRIA